MLLDGSGLAAAQFFMEVRGVGLISAVEFMADKERRRPFDPAANVHRIVAAQAVEQGVMLRPLPFIAVIPFSPPLCLTEADCDEAVDGFARALEAATPELHRFAGESPNRG